MEGWWEKGVEEKWWEKGGREEDEKTTHTCTGEQLAAYLEGSIGVSHYPREEEESGREEAGSGYWPSCLKVCVWYGNVAMVFVPTEHEYI